MKWVSVLLVLAVVAVVLGVVDTVLGTLLAVFVLLSLAELFKPNKEYYYPQKNVRGSYDVWRVKKGRASIECVRTTLDDANKYIEERKSLTTD